mmetsp:Transcript_14726/g.23021  ORF Transcript_14726/g.23021 Transcript_14726/m.23021 type:complete len:265 (+) Transcript_14726:242-1036(+)|eukprot:CAMPEP_0195264258 /NCGR_PEP_ID=MMETSP0706-20130129/10757_1 /TAXON_ID=33640 /ORGANISM="Asterionellopsis glacialis, Strain CCMP134" /LENGTH=264 /DNA_ID=CAMNT_0040318523 /DNA_START=186 /DNA_END=983 /DNA_ORIENTATION=+
MSIRSLLSIFSLSVLLGGPNSVFAEDRIDSTIAEYVADTGNGFNLLNQLVNFADAVDIVSAEGPITVFAPTDAAIYELIGLFPNAAEFATETELIQQVLYYHVVNGEVLESDLTNGMVITTALGENITANIGNDSLSITAANGEVNIVATDLLVSNGVIHTIDQVLIAQEVLDFLNPPDSTEPVVDVTTASPSFSPSAVPTISSVPTAAPVPTTPVPTAAPVTSAPVTSAPTTSAPTTSAAGVPQMMSCMGKVIVTLLSVWALM